MRRLRALVLTTKRLLPPRTKVVGDGFNTAFGDKEVEDFLELLSANNIPFDVAYADELEMVDLVRGDEVRFACVLLALRRSDLLPSLIQNLRRASGEYGVSLVASHDRIDRNTMDMFGVRAIDGKGIKFPCAVVLEGETLPEGARRREISLGDGLGISVQRWGFRRYPIRYLAKHFRKLWEQVATYTKIEPLEGTRVFARIKGSRRAAIVSARFGAATNYYIALNSDRFLDRFTFLHRMVADFVRTNSGNGMVSVDLSGSLILRMDDPGTSERVYLEGYDSRTMGRADWQAMFDLLDRHRARMSVMYVPVWVDDGRLGNGRLSVDGAEVVERRPAAMYDSHHVTFVRSPGTSQEREYDWVVEYECLCQGVCTDRLEIESHGLTHLDTDLQAWSVAPDRYVNADWYHEFRHVFDRRDCDAEEQVRVLEESARKIRRAFGRAPCAVTPSGHEQSSNSEQVAHGAGYKLFSSDYNSVRKNGLIIRNDKLRSIFLGPTQADPSYWAAGYPLVVVLHDYDMVLPARGIKWLEEEMSAWEDVGMTRYRTLRELAAYLGASIEAEADQDSIRFEVDISDTGGVKESARDSFFSNKPMEIVVHVPMGSLPATVEIDGESTDDFRYDVGSHSLRLVLPPFGGLAKRRCEVLLREDLKGGSGVRPSQAEVAQQ